MRVRFIFILLLAVGCRQPAPEPPPPPPTRAAIYYEEEVSVVLKPAVEVLEMIDSPPTDGQVTVIGRVINRGTGPSKEVTVEVSALAANGALVESRYATLTATTIAVGQTAAFTATFNANAEVDRYGIEVIAR